MALTRTLRFGFGKRRINKRAGLPREAMPFIRNSPGYRFVRDEGKTGIVAKRIPR
jgi:hypothetical protein